MTTGLISDPRLISGLLALLAVPILFRRHKPPLTLLILLFIASTWNHFINVKAEYGLVHYHEVGHYYLGSRYFEELGYFHLYDGILLVLSEPEASTQLPEKARDLRNNRLVDVDELLARQRVTAEDFGEARWSAFRADVERITTELGPKLETFLSDHGYNPTPVWTWLTRPLAASVTPGSNAGLVALTLVDALLLLTVIVALWWAWGRETALLSGSYLLNVFATFSWTCGSFCRYLWLASLVWGFCCLKKERYFLAGSLVTFAATLRIFPMLFLVPLMVTVARAGYRRRKIPRRYRRLLTGAATTGSIAVLGATAALGFGAWMDFFSNMSAYVRIDVVNAVSFQQTLATALMIVGSPPLSYSQTLSWLVVGISGLLAAIVAAAASRARDVPALAAGGALLCFLIFNLAAYYYVLLVLPFVVARDARARAGFFAVEAVCYLVYLTFDPERNVIFLLRNFGVGLLLFAPWLERGLRETAARSAFLRGRVVAPSPDVRV